MVISTILFLFALSGGELAQERGSSGERRLIVPPAELASPLGHCDAGDHPVDLTWMMRVSNTEIRVMEAGVPAYYRIVRDTVVISPDEGFDRLEWFSIPEFLHENGIPGARAMDVELAFVVIDGELALFWRETYRNRFYQQGLIGVSTEGLSLLCTGRGGGVSMR